MNSFDLCNTGAIVQAKERPRSVITFFLMHLLIYLFDYVSQMCSCGFSVQQGYFENAFSGKITQLEVVILGYFYNVSWLLKHLSVNIYKKMIVLLKWIDP